MFTTSRLLLRAYREEDKESFTRLVNDPLIQSSTSSEYFSPKSPKYMDEILSKLSEMAFFAVIEPLDSPGVVAGCIHVEMTNARNRNGTFGIVLGAAFQGKGFGTEATRFMVNHSFRHLGLHRLSLLVYEHNARAFEMYKKIGFVEEGRMREARFIDGKWEDNIHMGVLASEWKSRSTAA